MAYRKSTEEKIKELQNTIERAQIEMNRIQEEQKKKDEEKKQKIIRSILKDIEKALIKSPILELDKNSDEYKRLIRVIKSGEYIISEPENVSDLEEDKNGKYEF